MARKDKRTAENLKKDPVKYAAYLERKRRERANRVGYEAERKRLWRANNPESAQRIRQANHAVETAIEYGKLIKPEQCSRCGSKGQIQGHHWSYEKEHWLDVIWLCVSCHAEEHHGPVEV